MQRTISAKEKIAKIKRWRLIAEGLPSSACKTFQVQRIISQNLGERLSPRIVLREWVLRVLRKTFKGELKDVDTIPRGISKVQFMGFL